jgi:hypothetical protein
MDKIQINDIISSMLYLSGYSDFSVAIKPYKKPETGHLEAFLFI